MIYPDRVYFSFIEAFDIHTIADQASAYGHYFSAVVFYELLIKQLMYEEKFGKLQYTYFGEPKISLEEATSLLRKTKRMHDSSMIQKGQHGKFYHCNSYPFDTKMRAKFDSKWKHQNNDFVLDRDTLFSLKPNDSKQRRELGRKKWAEVKKYDQEESTRLFTATNIQMDILCNGTQMRVRLIFNKFVNYCHSMLCKVLMNT